ncbi:MAG: hypothetical protein IJM92_09520 [Fibrobacter sp.]|uniref:hypothetical protein n=1 Tax=Fibrobacter sp. TaxID=35828 RepID=UPI0025BEC78B|nr:hypothetical protein [Fibrobacter sp.]MBQ3715302.1 hypothetical protein [Fibrobacter sp.]MBQ7079877.1 hypothetical protein [Fibrobacter sp.]
MGNGKSISISFVGVLSTPLSKIPTLSREFGKELFGNESGTDAFFGPDGLVIMIPNKIVPMVIINQIKITVKADSADKMNQILSSLIAKLKEEGVNTALSAFGINYEIQYLNLEKESETWLWDRFIKDNIKTKLSEKFCNKLNFRMNVNEQQSLYMSIEPRMGVHDGLFVGVNHHHNISFNELPPIDEFDKYVKNSCNVVDNVLNEFIGE